MFCEPYNAPIPAGAPPPAVPDCAATPNASLAVPCTFSNAAPAGTPTNKPFAYPVILGTCHPGNIRRDGLPGPDFINTDFSLIKNTKLTERFNLQFRAEVFDIFNHPNFGNPTNTLNAAFGVITSTRFPTGDFGSSRQMAFALKLIF